MQQGAPGDERQTEELRVHEWLAISVLIGIMGCLAIVTTFHGTKVNSQLEGHGKGRLDRFDVLVKGAVDHPGVYHLQVEMPMKEILALAGVRQDADLRRYALEAYVKKGRVINVPSKQMITIFLSGAVRGDTTIKVPKGTKVSDLLSIVDLAEDADVEVLQKKRLLKPNETLHIPKEGE